MQQAIDGTESGWLKPFLRVVKITPPPTDEELQRWLDRFYPEIEAAGHAQSAHLSTDPARRRAGWANTKQIAVARWRFYLSRTPRELRTPTVEPVLEAIKQRVAAWTPEPEPPSLTDLGIRFYRH